MCPVSLISSYSSSDHVLLLLRYDPNIIYRYVFSSEESTLPTQWGIADSSIICCTLARYYSLIIYLEAPSFSLFNFSADQFHVPGYSMFSVLIGYQSALQSADTSLKTWCQPFLGMFWDFCERGLPFLFTFPVLYVKIVPKISAS